MTRSWIWKFEWVTGLTMLALLWVDVAAAQLQPLADETLDQERSIVAPTVINGIPGDRIEGGARRGGNLFHSFQEFNIDTGRVVYFANPDGVETILGRVTGGTRSQVLGRLGVLGEADLFLLNPDGILFGPNASLDIRGSFITSTADSLLFANGAPFSATNPVSPSLLTLNAPIGLQYGSNPGDIRVEGDGHNLSRNPETFVIIRDDRPAGLQVGTGQTFALVGGELTLAGGNLTAEGGRIELGSVTGGSRVTLSPINPGWVLDYSGVEQFQDIRLSQAASADSSGRGGGDIQVQGRKLLLSEGSAILADTLGDQPGGSFTVQTSESVELDGIAVDGGFPSSLTAYVVQGATGAGGELTLATDRLRLTNGGRVSTSTFGGGNAGILTIAAQSSVEVIGLNLIDADLVSLLSTDAQPGSTGDGNDLRLETKHLRLVDGGVVFTGAAGAGNAGNLTVQAQSVEVVGINPVDTRFSSSLTTAVIPGSTGNGGDLRLETDRLRLADGGRVSTRTFGSGDAGDLTVRAQSVEIVGVNPVTGNPSTLSTDARFKSAGDAGTIRIDAASSISLTHGGAISSAAISSDTRGGQGDIDLTTHLLLLRDNSTITTEARGLATGGNINIEAVLIAAGPDENNDIFANAFQGSGGRITLTAQAIFGLEPRTRAELQQLLGDDPNELTPRNLLSNDVTAFSRSSPNLDLGVVTFRTPDVDPSRGLVELPIAPLDAAGQITQTCSTGGNGTATSLQSEFIITGRGGLPANPLTPFDGDEVLAGWATLEDGRNNSAIAPPEQPMAMPWETEIVEATGWRQDAVGNIVLMAAAPASISQLPLPGLAHCP